MHCYLCKAAFSHDLTRIIFLDSDEASSRFEKSKSYT